jgi:hypothetical protein
MRSIGVDSLMRIRMYNGATHRLRFFALGSEENYK